jgi:hypothetical protein
MPAGRFGKYASSLLRRREANETSVEDVLARITDSGVLLIPPELIIVVLEASHEEHYRKVIMNHLHQCLTDVKPKAWKRLHAALILIEALTVEGSPTLVAQCAAGLHFDVVQKLSLVERFQHTSNECAQRMVRSKAKELRDTLYWHLHGDDGTQPSNLLVHTRATKAQRTNGEFDAETESTCSFQASVAGSLSSFDNVGISSLQAAKPCYDFEDLMEWAEADGENTSSDSCVD